MVSLLQTKIYPPIVSYLGRDSDGDPITESSNGPNVFLRSTNLTHRSNWTNTIIVRSLWLRIVDRVPSIIEHIQIINRVPSIIEHIQVRPFCLQIINRVPSIIEKIHIRTFWLQITDRIPSIIETIQIRTFLLQIVDFSTNSDIKIPPLIWPLRSK
uniref:Uncharacterized protein n=1 Tax=Salix viminalis TaxID=40686 RepID=A0A6N2JZX9_SALVM